MLEDVGRAVEEGRAVDALEAMLHVWRTKRAIAFADALDAIDVAAFPRAVVDGQAAWVALAQDPSPAVVGTLLANLAPKSAGEFIGRVELLAQREPDPRIALAFAKLTLDPPTTASSNYPVWAKIYDAIERAGDARALPVLEERLAMPAGASQFWGKFYRALARLTKQLPAPPEPTRAEAKAVKAIVKAAKKLEPVATARTPSTPAEDDALARAVAAAMNRDLTACLDALLVAWRARRLGELGTAIDRVSSLIDDGRAPPGGKPAVLHAAWLELARAGRAADVGRLADSVGDGKPSDAEARMEQMLTWAPDPRIGRAMLVIGISGSFTDRPRAWKLVGELLAQNADVRFLEPLERFESTIGERNKARRAALRRSMRAVAAQLADVPRGPGARDERLLTELSAALDAYEGALPMSERRFLEAIADEPDDDGPRLVYADWLLERGHPRGELITLQCSAKPNAKRIAALIEEHGRALLGPVAALAWNNFAYAFRSGMVALTKGLPSRLELRSAPPPWCYEGHPLLLALETLEAGLADVDTCCRIVRSARRMRRIFQAPVELVTALCRSPAPLAVDHLYLVHMESRVPLESALGGIEGRGLSRVKTFELSWSDGHDWPERVPQPILASPLLDSVDDLRVSSTGLGAWLTALRLHGRKVRTLTLQRRFYMSYRLEVAVDAGSSPTSLALRPLRDDEDVTVHPVEAPPLYAALRSLPTAKLPFTLGERITLESSVKAAVDAIVA